MTGAYRVDLAELSDVVDQLQRFDQRVQNALEAAGRQVDQLHAQWSGAAADEHRAAHQRWQHGCEEMRAALTVLRGVAAGAHQNYSAAVSANLAMWRV